MTVKWQRWGWSIVGMGAIACIAASPLRFPLLGLLNRPSAIADIQAMPFWFRLPVCIEGIVGDRAYPHYAPSPVLPLNCHAI